MKIIGVTGSSGAGKDTLCEILENKYEAEIVDADKIAKELSKKGTMYLQSIVESFGSGIVDRKGELNRKKLASIIYEDGLDDFQTFANNYLFALEKNGNFKTALNILDFVLDKYPSSVYFQKLKLEFFSKQENTKNTDDIIQRLFKPKKPFEISNFQSVKLLSKEKSLEDMIVEQIKYGIKVFGKELEIYQDDFLYLDN